MALNKDDDQTYGEKLVDELFGKLPQKAYRTFAEPRIITKNGHSKPDFVLVSAKYGVVVVEVKDWVKLLGGDQKQITIERRNGQRVTERNPYDIAEGYAHDLAKRFETNADLMHKYRGRRKLKFPWQPLVILPNIGQDIIRQFQETGIWPQHVIWGKEQVEVGAKRLRRQIENLGWLFRLHNPLDGRTFETICMTIDPQLVIVNGADGPIGGLDVQQIELVQEKSHQLKLPLPSTDLLNEKLKDVSESTSVRLVRGVAGSGKTLVLSRRATYLSKLNPDLKILVMTFNKNLMHDLQRRIPDVEVVNFHKICRDIIGDAWHSPSTIEGWLRAKCADRIEADEMDIEFVTAEIEWRKEMQLEDNEVYLDTERRGRGTALSRQKRERINDYFNRYRTYQTNQQNKHRSWMDWEDVPKVAYNQITRSGHPLRHTYDVVMIDEAQDFAPTWINVVHMLLRPGGELFICDDPTQSIFRNYSWREKGVEVVGRTRILKTPFRCTREISLAAHSLIQADANMSQSDDITQPILDSKELASGDLPQLIAYGSAEAEERAVCEQVHALIEQDIKPANIAVLCHSKRIVRKWAGLREHGIHVSDFRTMKGLEFKAVFVPHLDNAFTDVRNDNDLSAKRRNIYTAMTRARDTLILSYHQKVPEGMSPILQYVQQSTCL